MRVLLNHVAWSLTPVSLTVQRPEGEEVECSSAKGHRLLQTLHASSQILNGGLRFSSPAAMPSGAWPRVSCELTLGQGGRVQETATAWATSL